MIGTRVIIGLTCLAGAACGGSGGGAKGDTDAGNGPPDGGSQTADAAAFDAASPDAEPVAMALYGVIGEQLVTIDTGTGGATEVGPIGLAVSRAAYRPADDTVYGVYDNTTAPKLATIDVCTGAATHLVNLTIPGNFIDGFALEPGDDTLYGAVSADGTYPEDATAEHLVSIDPSTGESETVGDFTGGLEDGDTLVLNLPQPIAIDGAPEEQTFTVYDLELAAPSVSDPRTEGPPWVARGTGHQDAVFGLGMSGAIEGQVVTVDPSTAEVTPVGGDHTIADVAVLFSAPACSE